MCFEVFIVNLMQKTKSRTGPLPLLLVLALSSKCQPQQINHIAIIYMNLHRNTASLIHAVCRSASWERSGAIPLNSDQQKQWSSRPFSFPRMNIDPFSLSQSGLTKYSVIFTGNSLTLNKRNGQAGQLIRALRPHANQLMHFSTGS